ncbi:hypothetical protein J4219_01690 [Candidatus Woesearchaeota archaeon]|nr:hypothetical protein [Candidatus Woesearchaeota archaeon]
MAAIPWWAYLCIGLFVAIASAQIGGSISLFAWVGLLFVLVGIAKLVVLFILSPREKKKPVQQAHYQPRASLCPRCRMQVSHYDNYCRLCGMRLR